MIRSLPRFKLLAFTFFALFLLSAQTSAQSFSTVTPINAVSTSASSATGEKPQSKVWTYDGKWFAVFPSGGNTILWRLNNGIWTNDLVLTPGNAYADCKAVENAAHILLYKGTSTELVSLEYNTITGTYQLWSERPANVPVNLDPSVETATIDIDEDGRMWLASDGSSTINVRWSDAPYSSWSGPVTIASGITSDDICAVISLPGRTGVLWSNQTTKRYGFRTIANGVNPAVAGNWTADEIPASQSATNQSGGMADDHLNMKAGADGTLYCAVKTSYDGAGYPRIALLVRRPSGVWDDLYDVGSSAGTRPIVILNEETQKLKVLYTSNDGGGNILYKESAISTINFGSQQTLISGNYNNVTSSKQNYHSETVILASSGSQIVGVLASDKDDDIPPPADENLVLHLNMQEESGTSLIDASSYGNNGTLFGNAIRIPGIIGKSLALDGTNDYATVSDHTSLDITNTITLAAWIKPEIQGTQRIIYKVSGSAGYELFLANPSPQQFSVRFNDNASLRVNSTSSYMNFLNSWVHVAATYDGTTIKLYINGQLENFANADFTIAANSADVAIGATNGAADDFRGAIDEVRIYNSALTAADILQLAAVPPVAPQLVSPANNLTEVSLEPTLSWNSVPGAATYHLQVATNNDFTSLVSDQGNLAGTAAAVSGLTINTQYFWRVNATTTAGTGEWSAPWSFTTTTTTPPNPLVGYWKFEESALTTIVDSSVYGNNGSTIGNPDRVSGTEGQAIRFNGSSQYATVPDNAILDITSQITLAAWIRPGIQKTQYIIRKGNQNSENGYELSLSSDGKVFFRINQQANGNTYRVDSDTDYPTSGTEWMHVSGTYDGTSLKIYINGVLENTVSPPSTSILTNNQVLAIGAQSNGTSASRFNGSIDEARVYSIALSEAQIQALTIIAPVAPALISPVNNQTDVALSPTFSWNADSGAGTYRLQVSLVEDFSTTIYDQDNIATTSAIVSNLLKNTVYHWRVSSSNNSGTSPWSEVRSFTTTADEPSDLLVGHWKFEEASGTVITDASSYSNNGISVGDPSRTPGINGQALRLNGTDQYATVPDNPSLNISGTITLAAWIKPDRIGTQYIIRKGIQSSGDVGGVNGYELSLSNPGNVFFRFNQATNGDAYRVNSTVVHPADGNTWMHIAGTYDGITLRIYINGILDNSLTLSNPVSIATNNLPLNIGAQSSGSVSFDGDIDDVRIYNVALSEIEIQGLIAAALPVSLHSFTAQYTNAAILLNWQTASEDNNKGFHVERSADGIRFSTLGFVAGKSTDGNSFINLDYSFTDNQPLNGTTYYRLKQEDNDGQFKYSSIVSARSYTNLIQLQNLYPNPVIKDLNFTLMAKSDSRLDIAVIDMTGRVILKTVRTVMSGNNTISIDASTLKTGTYFLRVLSAEKKETGLYQFIKK